jgi:hypothetical protein
VLVGSTGSVIGGSGRAARKREFQDRPGLRRRDEEMMIVRARERDVDEAKQPRFERHCGRLALRRVNRNGGTAVGDDEIAKLVDRQVGLGQPVGLAEVVRPMKEVDAQRGGGGKAPTARIVPPPATVVR